MEKVFVAFPELALWAFGLLGAALIAAVTLIGRQLWRRLDDQDASLAAIQKFFTEEFHKIRNIHHGIDLRLTKIEMGCKWFHRNDDSSKESD